MSIEMGLYIGMVVAFLITSSGIVRGNRTATAIGAIAMAITTGAMFLAGWLYG